MHFNKLRQPNKPLFSCHSRTGHTGGALFALTHSQKKTLHSRPMEGDLAVMSNVDKANEYFHVFDSTSYCNTIVFSVKSYYCKIQIFLATFLPNLIQSWGLLFCYFSSRNLGKGEKYTYYYKSTTLKRCKREGGLGNFSGFSQMFCFCFVCDEKYSRCSIYCHLTCIVYV